MARPGTWQPPLTEKDRELAQKIGDTFEVEVTPPAVLRAALKFYAQHVGVEA